MINYIKFKKEIVKKREKRDQTNEKSIKTRPDQTNKMRPDQTRLDHVLEHAAQFVILTV